MSRNSALVTAAPDLRATGSHVAASQDGTIHVDVHDDGAGGVIVPGVGLTSLQRRAEGLGGRLSIRPQQPTGVHLHLELPRQAVA